VTPQWKAAVFQAAQQAAAALAIQRRGTVSSYDPATYAAKVILQPTGIETGWMPIRSPWIGNGWGFYAPPSVGDQVEVGFEDGDVLVGSIEGSLYSDVDRPLSVQSGELWWQHKSGSFWKLTNDQNVSITSAADTLHNATGNFTQSIGADSTHTISGNLSHSVSGDQTHDVSGDQTVTVGGSSTHTSDSHTINAPTSVNGAVEASSTVSAGGTVSSGGSVEAAADVTSDGGANSLNAIAAELPGVVSSLAGVATQAAATATSLIGTAASVAATASSLANVTTSLGNVSSSVAGVQTSLGNVSSSLANVSSSLANVATSLAALPLPGTNANSIGYLGIPQTVISANHTLALTDLGTELFCISNLTISIPAHGTLGQTLGSFVKITAAAGVTVTVSIASDTLVLEQTGATGSRTITGRGHGVFTYESTTEWWGVGIGLT